MLQDKGGWRMCHPQLQLTTQLSAFQCHPFSTQFIFSTTLKNGKSQQSPLLKDFLIFVVPPVMLTNLYMKGFLVTPIKIDFLDIKQKRA